MFNIVTIDLNTGKVEKIQDVTPGQVDSARSLFRKWIIPSFKDFRARPGKKSFRRIGNYYFTAWSRRLEYVHGPVEVVYCFRPSWEGERDEFIHLLRVGFTIWEHHTGRLRCPWVIEQGGIWEVYLSESAFSFLIDSEEWGADPLGLSNVS